MANHGAAALLLVASLIVAAAVSGADARLTVRPAKQMGAAGLRGANRLTVHRDANGGYVVDVAPVPQLTCNKVHEVQIGDTCFSVGQGEGLTQDQFLAFNPNINCEKIFLGQWVCVDATAA